jgi:hypothetical protein
MLRQQLEIQNILCELMLLEKDQDRIYSKIIKRATVGGQDAATVSDIRGEEEKRLKSLNAQELNTTYAYRDADKRRVANEKELKRIWAEEVKAEGSRSFFDETLIKVHWVGGYTGKGESSNPFKTAIQFIKSQPGGRIRDEISCFGYTPSQGIDHKPTAVGVIIKGYTTFAYAVDAATHMTSRATDVERRRHSGSGLHKRPMMSHPEQFAQDLVVDEESWGSVVRTYHEVVVDNWVVGGIIIPSFQQMIDAFKRNISGIGRERQGVVDKKVEEAKRNFQELGRAAAETGIPFYDDKLQPFDFSGKEFEVGELESEWNKVLTPSGGDLQGNVTGDPGVPEVVVEGRTVGPLFLDSLPKPITFRRCEMGRVDITNMGGSLVKIENCKNISSGVRFESGEGSIEVVNPDGGDPIISISQNFKLRRATFVGCNFRNRYTAFYERVLEDLQTQRDKNGAIITFENCENLPPGVEGWKNPLPAKQFYYHGPGREGVTQLSADDIAKIVRDISSVDHMVHVDGSWKKALSVPEVQDSFKKIVQLPPPPPPPLSEKILHDINLLEEDLQSFLDASQDISYSTSGHDPHFTGQDKPLKDKARAVKRLWMQHSDQKGLQRVVDLVHWFSDPRKQIPKFMSLSGNNEISTIMHPKTEELRSSWGGMGVLVKGWITLAANNMNDLMTLYGEKTRAKDMEAYRHSGLRKRPSHFYARSAGSYVLGPEDLDDYKHNEAVVANWKPVVWVIPGSFIDYLRNARRSEREDILDAVRASKLPVINGEGESIGMDELEEMVG